MAKGKKEINRQKLIRTARKEVEKKRGKKKKKEKKTRENIYKKRTKKKKKKTRTGKDDKEEHLKKKKKKRTASQNRLQIPLFSYTLNDVHLCMLIALHDAFCCEVKGSDLEERDEKK